MQHALLDDLVRDEARWVSVHLSPAPCEASLAALLVARVWPLLCDVPISESDSLRLFFVRDEARRQVRLRMRGTRAVELMVALRGRGAAALRTPPYVPEPVRYGGSTGMSLAYTMFEVSSRSSLEALSELERGAEQSAAARGLALQFALALNRALFSDAPDEARTFWWTIREGWLRSVTAGRPQRAVMAALDKLRCPRMLQPSPSWLGSYGAACRAYAASLSQAAAEGLLVCPVRRVPIGASGNVVRATFPIWQSQVHMTHNRLGLDPWDELTVAHLAMKAAQP